MVTAHITRDGTVCLLLVVYGPLLDFGLQRLQVYPRPPALHALALLAALCPFTFQTDDERLPVGHLHDLLLSFGCLALYRHDGPPSTVGTARRTQIPITLRK